MIRAVGIGVFFLAMGNAFQAAPGSDGSAWAGQWVTPASAQVAERQVTSPSDSSSTEGAERSVGESQRLGDRYQVLIDLDTRELHFKLGELTLWSAPIGIGSETRLITASEEWTFATPTGVYQVEMKERNPLWIAPDWFYHEHNLPVPGWNDPSRYRAGELGQAAIYFDPSLAIHGTAGPGVGVSHGCVRLLDRYVKRLYHNVQVGTEVVIVGGAARPASRTVDLRRGYDPAYAPRAPARPPPDPVLARWKAMPTAPLLTELERQLEDRSSESRWDETAIILLERAVKDDELARLGLLGWAERLQGESAGREWATYLADLYRKTPLRTLESLAGLEVKSRSSAAAAIVSSTLAQFRGRLGDSGTPWPTHRVPRSYVTPQGEAGWDALVAAEADIHDQILPMGES